MNWTSPSRQTTHVRVVGVAVGTLPPIAPASPVTRIASRDVLVIEGLPEVARLPCVVSETLPPETLPTGTGDDGIVVANWIPASALFSPVRVMSSCPVAGAGAGARK